MIGEAIAKLLRYYVLTATTTAGTGHASSSLSAVELMTDLFFGGVFKFDFKNKDDIQNDRIIFSKGHAAPLLYSMYTVAGYLPEEELMTLRTFESNIEGHPTKRFSFTEYSTGSLGQGLSVGVGFALALKQEKVNEPKIYVLLGDSEMAEGQNWEAMELASHNNLNNLIGIIDVNRLGQQGETLIGWYIETYKKRAEAFGWNAIVVQDGHNFDEIHKAYEQAILSEKKPVMIIAKTIKGKGVSFMENKNGFHGKPLTTDQLPTVLKELGEVDKKLIGNINIQKRPCLITPDESKQKISSRLEQYVYEMPTYKKGELVATRDAFGQGLVSIGKKYSDVVSLDAEMSNSTMTELFAKEFPERYFEMFIAEQNLVGVSVGFNRYGFVSFLSTFASFLTRAYDQFRMASYNESNLCVVGSHCGVCANGDGISQMGLEDIALFRSIQNSVVLQPSDAVSTVKLLDCMYHHKYITYMRTTKIKTPVLYSGDIQFTVGGSSILRESSSDVCVIFAVGVPLYEALKAADSLLKDNIHVSVVDTYSIKPLDSETILKQSTKNKNVVTVEDHYLEGGLGEAINTLLKGVNVQIVNLAVKVLPKSGSVEKLLHYTEIDSDAIIKVVKNLLSK